jgi:ketosteroid isomerase-like protein
MSFIRKITVALIVLLPATARGVHAQIGPADTVEVAVRRVVSGFGQALASGDSAAALALLHAEVVIYESGHAENREQYRSGHLSNDIAFASAVSRKTIEDQVLVRGDVAVYTSRNHAAGRFKNRDINRSGTETIVLVRTPAGWLIRHIHWS